MNKHGLWIVLILIFAGIILGTLGTWSVPLGHGISAFWPAFVVQVAGSVWFGGWGVLAAILFPILTNTFANVGLSGMLGFIPANLAQGLIPAWAFRHFRIDPAIPGNNGLAFYMIWGALIPATVGGLLGSVAVVLFGEASWSDYPLLVVKWATPHIVVSLLIGIPIMRELTPLWRDLGLLVTRRWAFEQASDQAALRPFRDIPIQLKLALAMGGAGLGPLVLLSLLELARNNGYSMPGNVMPLILTMSLVALVLAVGFLSRETVRPLQELQEQVESLVQYRDGVLTVERADEIGQLGQAFAYLLDDRRRAEASLQESEEKYRRLVENLNVGIFQSTLDGTFLHANSAVIHMAGYADWEEFKELPASFLYVDEADREKLIAELKAQGHVWNVETRSRKKDGKVYWIAISAVLLKDHEGRPVSILGSVADITDRKRVEDALRESESIFASFMEYSPVYVFFKDKELRSLRLSRNYEQMLGMPVGQMLGKTMDELFPSDLAKSMVEDDLRILSEGQRVDVVEELNGRVYETTKFPIFKDGKPQMLAGFTVDITERKRAEKALRESEAVYRQAIEVAGAVPYRQIYVSGTVGVRYTFIGEGIRQITGYGPEKFDTELWDSITLERVLLEDLAEYPFEDAIQRVRLGDNPIWKCEHRIRARDGHIHWVFEAAVELRDEHGVSHGSIGLYQDITARKQAEQALRESEERFRTLYDNATIGLYRTTPSGRILMLNPAGVRLLGYASFDEIAQRDLEDPAYFVDSPRKNFRERLEREGTIFGLERKILKKDGSIIIVRESAKVTRNENGEVLYYDGSFEDITERRQAEIERENLITELSIKNAELERFTYTVSHDLKSPLVTIRGFLGYLAQDALSGNTPRMEKDIERITNATEKMQSLLHDLLELSRIGRMMNAPETIQVEDLVHDALDLLHGQLEERHVTVLTQPDLPAVYGDRQRLTEVLQNLIDNAVKYMGNQTEPYIEVGQRGEESGRSIFFVRDNGIGIAPEYRERIFGLFNKLDPGSEGTGVGLALVKRIIEVHGGRIWVESEPGKGSTFYFSLQKN